MEPGVADQPGRLCDVRHLRGDMFDGFATSVIDVGETSIFIRRKGSGRPLLLLHGRFALAFWPWSVLSQPEPLPERLIAAAPEAIVDEALSQSGSDSAAFSVDVRAAYVDALRDREAVHAICEEYRAPSLVVSQTCSADQVPSNEAACVLWMVTSTSSAPAYAGCVARRFIGIEPSPRNRGRSRRPVLWQPARHLPASRSKSR